MNENPSIHGRVTLRLTRQGHPTGEVIRFPNLITGAARDALAGTLMGVPFGPPLSHIRLSNSTVPATLADTGFDPNAWNLVKPLRRLWMPAPYIVQADWTLTAGELTGLDLTEFALLRDIGGGDHALFSRVVRPPIHITPDLGIDGTWILSFAP